MKICIDPGHGERGKDTGAVYDFATEDDINLAIAQYLNLMLYGKDVPKSITAFMTRTRDEKVSLARRCELAKLGEADCFISIHCNAFEDLRVSGIEIFTEKLASPESTILAKFALRQLLLMFPEKYNRGIKKANYTVLVDTKNIPAILVECGFLSNPKDRFFLVEPENQLKLAFALKHAVLKFARHMHEV